MSILFWQNTLSKHQKDLLETLVSLNYEVGVVIEEDVEENRKMVGWDKINYENIKIYNIKDILNQSNEHNLIKMYKHHIFSSISSYKLIYKCFKCCEKLDCEIYIYSEDKDLRGIKGLIRFLSSKVDYLKHNKSIKKIFAIGESGVVFFKKIGFDSNKIIRFGYFIKPKNVMNIFENEKVKLLFVGNITKQKGLKILTSSIEKTNSTYNYDFDIYGDGVMKEEIIALSNKYKNINYYGSINNNYLLNIISDYDYLILPSLYDGWAVVVNEALLHGCNVVTTDAVGSSYLLKEFPQSHVLNSKKIEKELIAILPNLKPLTKLQRESTIKKADSMLSPKVGALKLIQALERKNEYE